MTSDRDARVRIDRPYAARLALIAYGVALVAAAGCGGATSRDPNEHSGGASSGGHAGSGGRAATGGQAMGGGGNLPEACSLPQAPGTCSAFFPSFWHDPSTGQCESFVYGGCGGNANRFATLAECQTTCGVARPSIDFCNTAADCVLTSAGCCAACEPLEAADLIAINAQHAEDRVCDVLCGACPPLSQEQRTTSRYFMPGCVEHQCTVVDIRETDAVSCQVDSDCRLRGGTGCCENCGGEPIAIRTDADLTSLFCPAGMSPCPPCPTRSPAGASSACVSGRCVVEETLCMPEVPCQ